MKKILALIFVLTALLAFTSCSSDLPEGMQLVYGGEDAGYYFYAPEEWTVPQNTGEIKSAYASRVDTTSVIFSQVHPTLPEGYEGTLDEYFFGEYFNDSLKEYTITPTVELNGELTEFGKKNETADTAKRYTFNYEYSEHKFGFTQILIKYGTRYFLFQYTALLEERTDGETYYAYYSDKVAEVIKNFRFVGDGKESDEESYFKDSDGYSLVSDSSLSGFDLYVPEGFTKDYSSAIVSATHSDGSNISLTRAVSTGVSVDKYWENRKEELEAIFGEITVIRENEAATLGNSEQAFAYEYTYEYNGKTYHVYQVLAVAGNIFLQNGYVLTFTTQDVNYTSHIEEIQTVITKVNFK